MMPITGWLVWNNSMLSLPTNSSPQSFLLNVQRVNEYIRGRFRSNLDLNTWWVFNNLAERTELSKAIIEAASNVDHIWNDNRQVYEQILSILGNVGVDHWLIEDIVKGVLQLLIEQFTFQYPGQNLDTFSLYRLSFYQFDQAVFLRWK